MAKPLLIIGNKNYSTWSLRAWLLLKAFEVDFDEQPIELFDSSSTAILKAYSPTGKVPVLVHKADDDSANNHKNNDAQVTVWDTLAIALYANDYLTDKDIWSGQSKAVVNTKDAVLNKDRAYCQSIVAEMHSGLLDIRSEMPMNIRATARIKPSKACLTDLARIEAIFAECLEDRSAGSYLFGDFTVADAFFAPVILRLHTYAQASGIELSMTTQQYCATMLNNPHVQAWREAALKETRRIAEDEAGEILSLVGVLG